MTNLIDSLTYRVGRVLHAADRRLGRILCANTLQFSFNVGGYLEERKARLDARPRLKAVRSRYADDLRRKGFCTLDPVHDRALISAIKAKFDVLIDDPAAAVPRGPRDLNGAYSRAISDPLRRIPDIKKLLSDDVAAFWRDYFGAHFRIAGVKAFRNCHVPDDLLNKFEVLSNRWHFDNEPIHRCDYWVPLTDVTAADGPTHIHTIDNSRRIVRMGFRGRSDYGLPLEVLEDQHQVALLTGQAGSKIMHRHPMTLHRAGVPAAGRYRDVVLFHIAPSPSPLLDDWERFVEPPRPKANPSFAVRGTAAPQT